MTQAQKAAELAATLRICADSDGCTRCPLDSFVGCCTEELKRESAEMIEDQLAQAEAMTKLIEKLRWKHDQEKTGDRGGPGAEDRVRDHDRSGAVQV